MEELNIASMEEKIFAEKFVSLSLTEKLNIGLERGGQAHLSIITHLILIQLL